MKKFKPEVIEQVIEDLINLQYQVAGIDKNYNYAKENDNWFLMDEISVTKYFEEFKPLAISVIRKALKVNQDAATELFNSFTLSYGLKFKKDEKM